MAKAKTAKSSSAPAKSVSRSRAPAKAAKKRKGAIEELDGNHPHEPGSTSLVIVESPAKAKTISKYLGGSERVRATVGHVRDLPETTLAMDIDYHLKHEHGNPRGIED